jgi:RNA-dependent RNA polymerase
MALKPTVQEQLQNYTNPDGTTAETRRMFQIYVDELAYICLTHIVTPTSDVRLQEEEIVVGTILAKCSQRRWRKDRMHRMRTHAEVLVQNVQRELMNNLDNASADQIRNGLMKAWTAWEFSLRHSADFGANSFGLIALGIIFDCLEKLDEKQKVRNRFYNKVVAPRSDCHPTVGVIYQ